MKVGDLEHRRLEEKIREELEAGHSPFDGDNGNLYYATHCVMTLGQVLKHFKAHEGCDTCSLFLYGFNVAKEAIESDPEYKHAFQIISEWRLMLQAQAKVEA